MDPPPPPPRHHATTRRSVFLPPCSRPRRVAGAVSLVDGGDAGHVDANPQQICTELVDQLKSARRRKKNRMYAKRSRQRRQSGDSNGVGAAKAARMQCKINALMAANDTLRGAMQEEEATLG